MTLFRLKEVTDENQHEEYYEMVAESQEFERFSNMFVCTARDVTENVKSQKRASRYEAFIDVIKDPMYVLDEDGRFELVNEAFSETFGYTEDELLGEDIEVIKDETALEQGRENLGQILSSDGEDSAYFETEVQPKRGEPIPCEDHVTALPYEGEYFNGSAGILRDISKRKSREKKLKRKNKRLNQFASIVSHDLRNPLQVAKGRRELIEMEYKSEHLDAMKRAHTRMEELIDDVLYLARAESQLGDKEPVSIEEISRECWENVQTDNATIHINSDTTVLADRSQLTQVFENLIRNAIEHTDQDVKITIGDFTDGFYVADNGDGIPEDKRDSVFEAGYTTAEDGTGFGLSIVAEVIEAHGWNISVTESSDGGARFEISNIETHTE